MLSLDVLCPLLSAEQLPEAQRLIASLPTPRAVAAELQARDWLTPYQADEVGKDRGRTLVVDKYVLIDRLGRGGMGDVLRARDTFMGRDVALKRIRDDVREAEGMVERFLREVKAAARLSHPNVVTVFDARDVDETLFMVMELVDGVDLYKFMQAQSEKRLSVASAVECVRQACEGMQHAHEKKLVHRDLKPANLLRTKAGAVKILDLGLAQLTDGATMTHTGDFMGTIDYVAPEQILDASRVDIRADVYSLGCTLYQLLCGKTPYADVHPAARASMHLSEAQPPAIESVRTEVPRQVADVVRRMMAKKRDDRYATPGEAAKALAALVRRKGEATPVSAPVSWASPATVGPSAIPPVPTSAPPVREFTNSIGMKFVLVPAGTFWMGSPTSDAERGEDEHQHEVRISKAFWMGVHPVTQRQWKAVMGGNPSHFCATGDGKAKVQGMDTDDFPVEQVSWEDVTVFLMKLKAMKEEAKNRREYRLPSEAEWEYSCRNSGTYQKYHFGDTISHEQANFGNRLGRTSKVGSYPANARGLHDMHGNVWEWCADWYGPYPDGPVTDPSGPSEGALRVFRGGGWLITGQSCRSAHRLRIAPTSRYSYQGIRVALVPAP